MEEGDREREIEKEIFFKELTHEITETQGIANVVAQIQRPSARATLTKYDWL